MFRFQKYFRFFTYLINRVNFILTYGRLLWALKDTLAFFIPQSYPMGFNMIYPHVEIKKINEKIGYGLFATEFIPKGTITYVRDPLEIIVPPEKFNNLLPQLKYLVDKYSYIDAQGNHIISWDLGNYVNHRCDCNTMSTGYGFEIAIKDIMPGEELTDEYGLFNVQKELTVNCGCTNCRLKIKPTDFQTYYKEWDQKIKDALLEFIKVPQPLLIWVDKTTLDQLNQYIQGQEPYTSVLTLQYPPRNEDVA